MNEESTIELTNKDFDLVWYLAGVKPCSLEVKKGDNDNWIERAGGSLPNYICEVAKGVMRSGKSRSAAIAIAVSRIKKWAVGGDDVNADTVAKAVKALAQWEALKARHAAKKLVKASKADGTEYLMLSEVSEVSLNQVSEAWERYNRELNKAIADAFDYKTADEHAPYSYVREVYLDFLIVSFEGPDGGFAKIPYTVTNNVIEFANPEPITLKWDDGNGWSVAARRL
jgi:hypothetical protein